MSLLDDVLDCAKHHHTLHGRQVATLHVHPSDAATLLDDLGQPHPIAKLEKLTHRWGEVFIQSDPHTLRGDWYLTFAHD